jgi:hypothetical protein
MVVKVKPALNDKTPGTIARRKQMSLTFRGKLRDRSGRGPLACQLFDLFLQAELHLFQLGNMKVIACGVVKFALDLHFKGPVPIAQLSDMRLKRHVLPTFV